MKDVDSLVILVDYEKAGPNWKFVVSANDGINPSDQITMTPNTRQDGWDLVTQLLAPGAQFGDLLEAEELAWLLPQITYYRQQQFLNRKVLIVCHYDDQTSTFTAFHEDGAFGQILSPPKNKHIITLNRPNAWEAVDLLSIIPF